MNNQIALYVPSTVNVNEPIDSTKYVNLVAKLFALLFGGSTIESVHGCYIAKNGELVSEPVTRVFSFVETLDDTTKARVTAIANLIKARMLQEYVAVEFITFVASEGMLFV